MQKGNDHLSNKIHVKNFVGENMANKRPLTEQDVIKIIVLFDSVIRENDWSKWQQLQDEYGEYTIEEVAKLVEDYKDKH